MGAENGDSAEEGPDEQEGEEDRQRNGELVDEDSQSRFLGMSVGDAGQHLVLEGQVPEVKGIGPDVEPVRLVKTICIYYSDGSVEVFDVLFNGLGRAGEL